LTACKVEVPEKLANAITEKLGGSKSARPQGGGSREKQTKSVAVVSGTISVKPGGYHDYRVKVSSGMEDARLSGRFTASGGSGNDIVVLVMRQDDYVNWSNGHDARKLYSSGQSTTGSIEVRLNEFGTYHLVYSNRFSTISSKDVTTEVNLKYESY
jgi:hypothetical protein